MIFSNQQSSHCLKYLFVSNQNKELGHLITIAVVAAMKTPAVITMTNILLLFARSIHSKSSRLEVLKPLETANFRLLSSRFQAYVSGLSIIV